MGCPTPHRKIIVHVLSRSIISSLWRAVGAMSFTEFKIGSVFLPHEAKALLELFCFSLTQLVKMVT